jgi:hypothetical protein
VEKGGRRISKIKVQKSKLQSKNQKLKPIGLSRLKIRDIEYRFNYDLKKQSQFASLRQTIPKACGFEAATQIEEREYNLKKQSQFFAVQIGVRTYLKGTYGNI